PRKPANVSAGRSGSRNPPPPPPRRPPPRTRAGGDDDDDEYRDPPPRKGSSTLFWVLFGVGGFLAACALVLCTGMLLIYFGAYSVVQQAAKSNDEINKNFGLKQPADMNEALEAVKPINQQGRRSGALHYLYDHPVDAARKKEVLDAVKPIL